AMEIKTLNDIFTVTCGVDRPAVLKSKKNGEWVDVGVPEFRDTVRHVATALRYLGVKPCDRVAMLAENRPERAMGRGALLASAAAAASPATTGAPAPLPRSSTPPAPPATRSERCSRTATSPATAPPEPKYCRSSRA